MSKILITILKKENNIENGWKVIKYNTINSEIEKDYLKFKKGIIKNFDLKLKNRKTIKKTNILMTIEDLINKKNEYISIIINDNFEIEKKETMLELIFNEW